MKLNANINYTANYTPDIKKMYEVDIIETYRRGVNTATIYKSNDLKDCEEFAEKWNDVTNKLYEGKCIPDIWLNELNVDSKATEEDIEDIIHNCYTGKDFMEECHDMELKEITFV